MSLSLLALTPRTGTCQEAHFVWLVAYVYSNLCNEKDRKERGEEGGSLSKEEESKESGE